MSTPATSPATASEALASHFAGLTAARLPASLLEQSRTLVLDYLGVAVAGCQSESGRIAARFAAETGGRPEATVLGRSEKVPAVHAAFANAISSHSLELDDVDVLALFHFSPPVVSAALAVAEREQASGEAFLTAVAAGCEMMARASAATNPSLRNRGYHTTPVCGVFGAAVAAGRLIGLDEPAMVSALGLAGAQASGLMEMYGPSMHKRFNPGPAARNGVTAAVIARMGFTGAATIFDGERGFCRAFSDGFDLDALTRGLGTDFPVFMEFKPYSSARPIHNAIDCALAVRRELGDRVSQIRAITMRRHPAWAHYHLNPRPRTYHEAQVSLPFSTAVALVEGAALLPQYQDDRLADPEIVRLASLVHVVPDDTLPRGVSCLMVAETDDGQVARAQVDHPRGSIVNPMTGDEMRAKVRMLAEPVIGTAATSAMIEAVAHISDLGNIGELTALLAVPGVSA
jgi:2-methylcitrate dehydratase PrpD